MRRSVRRPSTTSPRPRPCPSWRGRQVFDLGYYDHGWWAALDAQGGRIVTRLKQNTPGPVIKTRAVPTGGNLLSDRGGDLPARQANRRRNPFAQPVCKIQVMIDTGNVIRILSNDLTAAAAEMAALCKQRWAIELFFRRIKQTLKVTRFPGTAENAGRIRVAVALIAFVLLRRAQAAPRAVTRPLTFARLIRANLMPRRDLRMLLRCTRPQPMPISPPCRGQKQCRTAVDQVRP
ncbi:MAG: transposase [Stellaceae bacterium]